MEEEVEAAGLGLLVPAEEQEGLVVLEDRQVAQVLQPLLGPLQEGLEVQAAGGLLLRAEEDLGVI
jgi:hypothetical protein